jgi:hypothetical protein
VIDLADIVLTLKQIEDLFQSLTCTLLGLNPAAPSSQDKVRIAWPTGGAPAWKINQDIAFLRINLVPDPYTQQRETSYQQDTAGVAVNVVASYTRVHSVQWVVYGPNSFENAETIRNGIFLFATKSTLAAKNLHLILDVPPVVRLPELLNGQWWQRADLQAKFNEKVTRYSTVPFITGTGIKIYTENGEVN